jgi:hypothetical protein
MHYLDIILYILLYMIEINRYIVFYSNNSSNDDLDFTAYILERILKMLSVDTFLQDQQARGGSQTACGGRLDRVGRSDRLYGAVRPVCRDQPAVDLRTSTREGPRRS